MKNKNFLINKVLILPDTLKKINSKKKCGYRDVVFR